MNSFKKSKTHIFRFKQFSLTDKHCGMKIGTDGVLLGAIASSIKSEKVLDIGTGSGLIALMIAQKQNAEIESIEIDDLAYKDALINFQNSKWQKRLKLFKTSFQEYTSYINKKYDLIICNPPFFHNSMKPAIGNRKVARHSDSLSFDDLLCNVKKIIKINGRFLMIYPASQSDFVNNLIANYNFFITEKFIIRPTQNKNPHRIAVCLSCKKLRLTNTIDLAIETGKRHEYTKEYIKLTSEYYLHM